MKGNLLYVIIIKKFYRTHFSEPCYLIKILTIFTTEKFLLIQLFWNSLILILTIMLSIQYLQDWLHNFQGWAKYKCGDLYSKTWKIVPSKYQAFPLLCSFSHLPRCLIFAMEFLSLRHGDISRASAGPQRCLETLLCDSVIQPLPGSPSHQLLK